MKKWHIVILIIVGILLLLPSKQDEQQINVVEYTQTLYTPSSNNSIVVARKPTIGECIVAPIDFVVGICSGVIKGVGYGTAYIAETITPGRLYSVDNKCCYCNVCQVFYGEIEHHNCKLK